MPALGTIRLGCFYRSLPMMAGTSQGFYEEQGLEVDYQQVQSSTQQFEYLRDNQYDVVQTSPDNVANYRYNDGNPIGGRVDAQGFVGLDYGMLLILVAREGITSVEQLRGKTLSVDALDSGFAYGLYKILAAHGLQRDTDYSVVSTGGVFARYQRFMETDEFDATLLSGGFETRAANAGYVLLDAVTDIASPYLGVVAAAKQSWLSQNAELATAFVRAYLDATDWVFDPENKGACLQLLQQLPNTSPELAAQLYDIQLREGVGNVRDGAIDPAAVRTVMALRSEYGGFEEDHDLDALAAPESGLYDLTYYEAARSARGFSS